MANSVGLADGETARNEDPLLRISVSPGTNKRVREVLSPFDDPCRFTHPRISDQARALQRLSEEEIDAIEQNRVLGVKITEERLARAAAQIGPDADPELEAQIELAQLEAAIRRRELESVKWCRWAHSQARKCPRVTMTTSARVRQRTPRPPTSRRRGSRRGQASRSRSSGDGPGDDGEPGEARLLAPTRARRGVPG